MKGANLFPDMKKFLLNPFCALICVACGVLFYLVLAYGLRAHLGVFELQEVVPTEELTYVAYGVAFGVVICMVGDYIRTPQQGTFFGLCFLWLVALLREMGAQHWLTSHDTTAIKMRFFTNPDNPLHEKIITGLILLAVVSVVVWLLVKYIKKMVCGFFKLQPLYWTLATIGGVGIVSKIIDRLPANYAKSTGEQLAEPVAYFCKLVEEGGESFLPLLFALALIQYHFIIREKNTPCDGGSKAIASDSV